MSTFMGCHSSGGIGSQSIWSTELLGAFGMILVYGMWWVVVFCWKKAKPKLGLRQGCAIIK